jgi:RNA polymerase sigma-70 factor (ECF subfamily)
MNGNENKVETEGFSLEALHKGDPEEFSRLVDAYSSKIYRLAIKMLNQQQDAEDVLQETFLKAYRGLKSFDGRSKLSTWLFRIATNEALMVIRRKHPEVVSIDEPVETEEGEQEPIQIIDWCCLPENELLSEETREKLDAAVQKLPERLKVVFLLRDIDDLSTHETAEVLGLSATAVKTRLSRARLRLREELSTYFGERTNDLREARLIKSMHASKKEPRESASSLQRRR